MKDGKIRVGVIGVHPERGWAMTAHIPALQSLSDYELVAMTNSHAQLGQQAAKKFHLCRCYCYYDTSLNSSFLS